MTHPSTDPARILADSLNADPAIFAETLLRKFLVRWKLFAACALLVPVFTVGVACIVPTTYKCTAQVLVRH